jgi:hypothetical protein
MNNRSLESNLSSRPFRVPDPERLLRHIHAREGGPVAHPPLLFHMVMLTGFCLSVLTGWGIARLIS